MPFWTQTITTEKRGPCRIQNSLVRASTVPPCDIYRLISGEKETSSCFSLLAMRSVVCQGRFIITYLSPIDCAHRQQHIHCASFSAFWRLTKMNKSSCIKKSHLWCPRTKRPCIQDVIILSLLYSLDANLLDLRSDKLFHLHARCAVRDPAALSTSMFCMIPGSIRNDSRRLPIGPAYPQSSCRRYNTSRCST
jgi:hypothetical protein